MLITSAYIIGGFAALLICAEWVVRGAVAAAQKMSIPPILVGLTVVAFGTSAPELFISGQAVLDGLPEIALGNIVGSNIANILLVVGVPALFTPIVVTQPMIRRNLVMMLGATALMMGLALTNGFCLMSGAIMLMLLALYLSYSGIRAVASSKPNPLVDELTDFEDLGGVPHNPTMIIFYLVVGLIGLPVGAQLLVEGAVRLATSLGIPNEVISISIIALGTSLPELATVVAAALRRQSDVILGSIIGSNLFNILAVAGVSSTLGPLTVPEQFLHFDLWVMTAASLAIAPAIFTRHDITWRMGLVFLAAYGLYIGLNYAGTLR